jgi:hypothetical protein
VEESDWDLTIVVKDGVKIEHSEVSIISPICLDANVLPKERFLELISNHDPRLNGV